MEDYKKAVVPSLIIFLFTFIFQYIMDYYKGPRGEIIKTEGLYISGSEFTILDIRNYSKSMLNDLIINIPTNLNLDNINISTPLFIENVDTISHSYTHKQIKVSGIPPEYSTKIVIPVSSGIDIVNYEEKNMKLQSSTLVKDPIYERILSPFIIAFIYTISFFCFELIQIRREKRIILEKDSLSEKLSDIKKEFEKEREKIVDELNNSKNQVSRVKILLMARLSDYAKELDFWRNTIRKIMYKKTNIEPSSEQIIEVVTDELKTYQTRMEKFDENNFKTIEYMASMLSKK